MIPFKKIALILSVAWLVVGLGLWILAMYGAARLPQGAVKDFWFPFAASAVIVMLSSGTAGGILVAERLSLPPWSKWIGFALLLLAATPPLAFLLLIVRIMIVD